MRWSTQVICPRLNSHQWTVNLSFFCRVCQLAWMSSVLKQMSQITFFHICSPRSQDPSAHNQAHSIGTALKSAGSKCRTRGLRPFTSGSPSFSREAPRRRTRELTNLGAKGIMHKESVTHSVAVLLIREGTTIE